MAKVRWVKVRAESELKVGMCVELRPCAWCGKRERFMLTHRQTVAKRCTEHGKCRGFEVAGRCDNDVSLCSVGAISAGSRYRLQDDDTTDDYATSETTRKERA